jgi:hypothetical protein
MDIKNLGEFVGYCQERTGDVNLGEAVEFAQSWADFSTRLAGQYGGHGESLETWIGEAHKRMGEDGVEVNHAQLLRTHEILTRFWKTGGEAFDRWFRSKVIIVSPS